MARVCEVCRDAKKAKKAAQMIAAGATDNAVAQAISVSRLSVRRHRINHLVAPLKAVVAAAQKDTPAKEERKQLLAAAEAGTLDPAQYLSLAAIVGDLRRTGERLERVAVAAEAGEQPAAVAALSGQLIRSVETRAKLGSVGGFAAKSNNEREPVQFSVTYIYNDGRSERLDMARADGVPPLVHAPALASQPFDFTTVGLSLPQPMPVADEGEADEEDEDA